MRLLRHAAIALLFATFTFGGPISAAPISDVPTQTIAQATSTPTPPSSVSDATLTGTVYNGATNKVLGGVALTISNPSRSFSTTTAGDGSFTVSLPAGIYDIDASRGGFQGGRVSAFALAAGATSKLPIYLAEAASSELRTIGRVSVTRRNSLNLSASAQTSLDAGTIQQQDLPNLTTLVGELPGVTVARTTGATANTFFDVRGAEIETRVNIEGHPLSVGTFGAYNTNYATSAIFQNVEVLKGAGLNGPTAGESAFGTINLQTRDFSPNNYLDIKGGLDGFGGSLYNAFGNVNLFKGKLSLLGGKAFSGYRGPTYGYIANRVGSATGIPAGTGQIPTFPGTINYQSDFSNTYNLAGELAKMRFRFSDTTSVSAEYLGLQGQYIPQGGSYGSFEGTEIVQACYNGSAPQPTFATCTNQSVYNAPYARGLVGTAVPAYFYFPSSYIQNNEPQFSAELRTALKNDTILVRPYTALINRFISGDRENRYPGNAGGFYQVTSDANCQARFVGPTAAAAGAKGPCFGSNFKFTGPAYIGASDPASVVYTTTGSDPGCSAATPCYTTPTAIQNNGAIGFGTPFSQPEIDRLHGVTFQYLHPVHDNLYGFSYDYNADDTYSMTNDTTSILAGCTGVVGSGVPNTVAGAGMLGVQPTCGLSTLPRIDIAIPPTIVRKNDFALTGQLQLTPALQAALGLYYTNYRSQAQAQNPAVIAAYSASQPSATGTPVPGNSNAAPVSLVQNYNSIHHVDPHVGFTYRVNQDLVLRATGGSSITLPYASVISGLGSVDLPNGSNNNAYTLSLANSQLANESTVAYDLGFDYRLRDSSIFSVDAFDNTVHNAFASVKTLVSSVGGINAPGGFFQSETINVPVARYYGAEFSLNKSVQRGFGYTATATLERAYVDQLPNSIYTSRINLINGKQLDGSSNPAVPYAKGYAEIRYGGIRDSLVSLGADYQGNNNSTYGPAFTLFNATVRFEVAPTVAFQMSVDNLTNVNTGSSLGRALFNQGVQTITYGPATPGAPFTYGTTTKQLQTVDFRTVRFTLQHRF